MHHSAPPRVNKDMRARFPVVIFAAAFLAACSSGGGSAQPAAAVLARQIPGCSVYPWPTHGLEATLAACNMGESGPQYVIATFSSSADEAQWIANDGSDSTSEASTGQRCCVQGSGWAVAESPYPSSPDFSPVLKALGGKQVSP